MKEISNNRITLDCPISFDAKETTPASVSRAIPIRNVTSSEYVVQMKQTLELASKNEVDNLNQVLRQLESLL